MARVVAQSLRPFQGNKRHRPPFSPRRDPAALLADRDRLYSRADVTLDTSGKTLRASLSQLLSLVKT